MAEVAIGAETQETFLSMRNERCLWAVKLKQASLILEICRIHDMIYGRVHVPTRMDIILSCGCLGGVYI